MSTYIPPFFVVEKWLFPLKVLKGAQPLTLFHKNPTTDSTGFDTFKRNIFDRCKWLLPTHGRFPIKVSKKLVWGMSGKDVLGNKHPDFLFSKHIFLLDLLNFLDGYMAGKEVL